MITIPEEIWNIEKLKFGDYIEIEIKKAKEATEWAARNPHIENINS